MLVAMSYLSACSIKNLSPKDDCKIRTYTNFGLQSYTSKQFGTHQPVRIAVLPFEVPETFAYHTGTAGSYGAELANRVKAELVRSEEPYIVEYFSEAKWVGKKEDFFDGNYAALNVARNAGYDLIVLGYLTDITPQGLLELQTKIIDTNTAVTIFWARTALDSSPTVFSRAMMDFGYIPQNDSNLRISERSEELVRCTTRSILTSEGIPIVQEDAPLEQKPKQPSWTSQEHQ